MNNDTLNVHITIEGAHIGDEVVATSRHNTAVVAGGRLVDVNLAALILDTTEGWLVFPHDHWSFAAAPPAPDAFEAHKFACAACAAKAKEATPTGSMTDGEQIAHDAMATVETEPTSLWEALGRVFDTAPRSPEAVEAFEEWLDRHSDLAKRRDWLQQDLSITRAGHAEALEEVESLKAEVDRLGPVETVSGQRVNPIAHAAEMAMSTGCAVEIAGVRIEPLPGHAEAAHGEVLDQILAELRRLTKRAAAEARAAGKVSRR